jgi:Chromo (CHRromatin Organisation MOdifier) domain
MDAHGPNFTSPPPEIIEGEPEYEVECILASHRFGRRRKLQYLVKWLGYPLSENSWQDATDVHTPDLVREFQACHWPSQHWGAARPRRGVISHEGGGGWGTTIKIIDPSITEEEPDLESALFQSPSSNDEGSGTSRVLSSPLSSDVHSGASESAEAREALPNTDVSRCELAPLLSWRLRVSATDENDSGEEAACNAAYKPEETTYKSEELWCVRDPPIQQLLPIKAAVLAPRRTIPPPHRHYTTPHPGPHQNCPPYSGQFTSL